MRRIILAVFAVATGLLTLSPVTSAISIQIKPTIYKNVELKKGEKKKSYVDIANPTAMKQTVTLSVKAFRQIDSEGMLQFYDSEQVAKGVQLDLTEFELNPKDVVRVYFLLDGSVLPSGDVFAAIFAETVPRDSAVAQSVRVGTLLSIVNGTPSSHSAAINNLNAPLFQWGDGIQATFSVKNTAAKDTATGFFPRLRVALQPYSEKDIEGPLVFAGIERSVSYRDPGNYFGIMRLNVSTDGGSASRWLFAMTGFWRWLAPLIALVIVGSVFAILKRRRR